MAAPASARACTRSRPAPGRWRRRRRRPGCRHSPTPSRASGRHPSPRASSISPMTISAMRGEPRYMRRVALDHDDQIAEGRYVRPAGGRGTEEAADLGHPPREAHLVVEDPARSPTAGEQFDLVGDAGARRIHQPEDRELVAQGPLGQPHDLLDRAGAPGAGLDGGVVGHHADRAAFDRTDTRDDPVGRKVLGQRVGQQAVLDERARVEQQVEPFAHEQLVLRGQLGPALFEVAAPGPGRCAR